MATEPTPSPQEPTPPTPERGPLPSASEGFSGVDDERLFGELRSRLFDRDAQLRVGRYRVLRRLGAGAMGEVQLATDEELDRRLAIKFLHAHLASPRWASSLRREARALARLAHPNVVHVYEVGAHQGRVYLAMEYIEGGSLREWLRDDSPGWEQVLAAYLDAARGLAAAHGAGVVHRDFKPDNVLRGVDGRIAVADFGLAALEHDESVEQDPSETLRDDAPAHSRTCEIKGTPAYMPPEQFRGHADARADQFSLCVALYEGLWGRRPFRRRTTDELLAGTADWTPTPPPRRAEVPNWLWPILRRGLAAKAQERWPDVNELIAALEGGLLARHRRRRRLSTLGVGLLSALLGGATWGALAVDEQQQPDQPCLGMEARLDGVWDDTRRGAVERAMLGTELSYAAGTWERVERELDGYAAEWVAARRQACEATHREEQSGELLDLRMACLDGRLSHLRATVGVLEQADEAVVKKAVQAALALPRLERCADAAALEAEHPPPEDPEVAERVAQQDERLIEAKARQDAGKYADALSLADAVVGELEALDYEPLAAQALLRQGALRVKTGDHEGAKASLELAYYAALAQGMTVQTARASSLLVYLTGVQLGDFEAARRWAKHADPLSRAVGGGEARATYLSHLGKVMKREGDYEEARDLLERALALREQAHGPRHLSLGSTLNGLGNIARAQNNGEDARELYERAAGIFEDQLGPDHPNLGYPLTNLGLVVHSPEGAAREYHERALAIWEKAYGPNHPDVAGALSNLGIVARSAGNYEQARGYYQRALAIFEGVHGPDHPNLLHPLVNLGNLARVEGDHERAREHLERALAIQEATRGADNPSALLILSNLGEALVGLGEHVKAIDRLEQASSLDRRFGGDPIVIAGVHFALARALWEAPPGQGRDRTRALELGQRALAVYAESDEEFVEVVEDRPKVEAWLAARSGL